jgi:hypothetical protein
MMTLHRPPDPLGQLPAEAAVASRLVEVRREERHLRTLLRLLLALRDEGHIPGPRGGSDHAPAPRPA